MYIPYCGRLVFSTYWNNKIYTFSFVLGLKDLPLIHGYDSIQALNKDISKSEREHDLVIAVSNTFEILH